LNLPTDAFKFVLALLIAVTALWMNRTPDRLRSIGAVEAAMALYLLWNIYSMFAPHKYDPGQQIPLDSDMKDLAFSVPSFIGIGVVVPFVSYLVGRYTFDRTVAVRAALWTILALAAYSAVMSILPFTGPTKFVWPSYIVDNPTEWSGRAVGVFLQPLVNGMVLVLGVAIAMLMASRRSEPALLRLLAFMIAPACLLGLYMTHTRMAQLCGVMVLLIGAVLAKGWRVGFIALLGLLTTFVVVKWSVLISADRQAGGVGSTGEIQDRLNVDKTAFWAAAQKPLTGWGIGRFSAVNTYHHQQWSLDTPWIRGYAAGAHENELAILTELGLIGLVPWMCVLALLAYRLWKAYRILPYGDLCGQPIVVIAIMALAVLICAGFASDLRLYGFPLAAIFLLVGIAVGWADRHTRGQPGGGGANTEQLEVRYA
jgi:O-antigen ligase